MKFATRDIGRCDKCNSDDLEVEFEVNSEPLPPRETVLNGSGFVQVQVTAGPITSVRCRHCGAIHEVGHGG